MRKTAWGRFFLCFGILVPGVSLQAAETDEAVLKLLETDEAATAPKARAPVVNPREGTAMTLAEADGGS